MIIVSGGPVLGFRVVMGVSAAMLPSQVPGCRMYKSQGQVGMIGVLACKRGLYTATAHGPNKTCLRNIAHLLDS